MVRRPAGRNRSLPNREPGRGGDRPLPHFEQCFLPGCNYYGTSVHTHQTYDRAPYDQRRDDYGSSGDGSEEMDASEEDGQVPPNADTPIPSSSSPPSSSSSPSNPPPSSVAAPSSQPQAPREEEKEAPAQVEEKKSPVVEEKKIAA